MPDSIELEMDSAPSAPRALSARTTPVAAPTVAPAAPVAAPAVTVAPVAPPSLLVEGRQLFAATTTEAALDDAARAMALRCVAAFGPDANHPTRVELRAAYKARKVELERVAWVALFAALWARIWGSLVRGVTERPALVVRPAVAATVEPTGLGLAATLGNIATEGAANASTQGAGSLAGGQMRGVGYSSAEGYVRALGLGVKAGTAEEYKRTLRDRFGYTPEQVAGLTVTLLPESDRPVGAGVLHKPDGKSTAEMTREELRAHMAATNPAGIAKAQAAAVGEALKQTVLHGLVSSGRGLVVSPGRAQHGVTVPASELRAALAQIDRDDLAPKIKSSVAQFGAVMGALNGNGLRSWAAKRREAANAGETWPADTVSRWIVGHLNGGSSLGSLGDKELVAELTSAGEVRFVGGSATLRGQVVDAFDTRIAEQAYNATDLLAWFRRVLYTEFHGVEWGGFIYCPGNKDQVAPVRAFVAAVKPLLGRTIGVGEAVSDEALVEGIGDSLLDEVIAVEKAYTAAQAAAAKREYDKAHKAGLPTEDCELAARRAVVLSDAAGTRIDELNVAAGRVDGFAPMLGELQTKAIRARIEQLRSKLTPLIDATSERFRQMDLT
jgi:hypothetical protein